MLVLDAVGRIIELLMGAVTLAAAHPFPSLALAALAIEIADAKATERNRPC